MRLNRWFEICSPDSEGQVRLPLTTVVSFLSNTGMLGGVFFLVACDAGPKFGVAPPPPAPSVISARAHVINGTVTGPGGRPIPGAWVEWDTDFSLFEAIGVEVDSAGSYRIDFAPGGRYIEMRARSNDPGWANAPIVMLQLDTLPETVRVDFTLQRR